MCGRRLLGRIFLAAVAVCGPGCLGPDGATGVGFVPGALKSCHDFPTTFRDTWFAARQAMQDLKLDVTAEKNDGASGTLTSRAQNGAVVAISIVTQPRPIPIDGLITHVCVRVGTFGDQETSDRILARIADRLAQPASAPAASGPTPAPVQVLTPTAVPTTPAGGQKPAEIPLRPIVISPAVSRPAPGNGQ